MRIKQIREQQGIKQKDFALSIGIAANTLSQYETGKRQPDPETLKLIASGLNVTVDELLGTATKKMPTPEGEHKINNPDIRMIARAGQKMTPEQAENLRKYAQFMYPEAFDDNE